MSRYLLNWSVIYLFFKQINSFSQHRCIKLTKSDQKLYNVTQKFCSHINVVLLQSLLICELLKINALCTYKYCAEQLSSTLIIIRNVLYYYDF